MARTVYVKKAEPAVAQPKPAAPAAAPAPKPVVSNPAPAAKRKPTHDEIAKRAYEVFLRRGNKPGNAKDDWMQAERELSEGK